MDKQQAREIVLKALRDVAPDLDGVIIKEEADLRRDYDIDSADYLAFIIKLHEQTLLNIPELDYPRLATVDGAISYLSAQQSAVNAP